MIERPFAVFDIDGTIIRWQLYHALADELAHRSLLDSASYQRVRAARMDWKTRMHQGSFTDYEQTLINLIDVAITDIGVNDFKLACQEVIEKYKDQVYTFTRDLIGELKAQNYLLFAISASQSLIVQMLAEYYGFDDFGGSVYETEHGRFTGKKHLMISDQKPLYLNTLVEKHGAIRAGSIAVGDTESDIPMLSVVEKPIAFNPTRTLFEHATAAHWRIVVERKNMIYQLEHHAEGYHLSPEAA
jgi:HAD superfamily hydrolase (TIGR01490 family)